MIKAATMGKAAEDGSAGTTTGARPELGAADEGDAPPFAFRLDATSAPKWASIFSVWSREASLSTTVVRPRALRPASRTADLIWAEATGVR